jgi:hypothetical protein
MQTDLNAFYPNIYTHSVPWALHTKAVSKKKRTDYSLLGNRLDLALRNGQGQQTIGIPIGPDTSLVIAEILGSAVDVRLPQYVQDNAIRYMDDVECGFMTATEADSALAAVQNEFSEFELNLNPRKTQVAELPLGPEASWVPHLRLFPIGRQYSQRTDLLGFFGRAFELAREQREEAVLKYAIQRMRSIRISEENWPLYEDLLLGCLAVESGCTPAVVSELVRYATSHPLAKDRIETGFERLIAHHAPQHHGSEVAWSIWYLATSGMTISAEAAGAALKIPDPVVALCLLHARDLGRTEAGVDWSPVEGRMRSDELFGPFWLLSYEASIKGWLSSKGSGDHLAAVSQFDYLRSKHVSFYDALSTLPVRLVKARFAATLSEHVSEADFELAKEGSEETDNSEDYEVDWVPGLSW